MDNIAGGGMNHPRAAINPALLSMRAEQHTGILSVPIESRPFSTANSIQKYSFMSVLIASAGTC
jgi:hypothetical protein